MLKVTLREVPLIPAGSANGRQPDSESGNLGSIPSPAGMCGKLKSANPCLPESLSTRSRRDHASKGVDPSRRVLIEKIMQKFMSREEKKFDYLTWWLNAEDIAESSIASKYANIGITPELYMAWSRELRRPIYAWLELKWTRTTEKDAQESGLHERAQTQLESAKMHFCEFLWAHPDLPTTAVRPLLEDVIGKYYSENKNMFANPVGYLENRTGDIDKFIDAALVFYRDRAGRIGIGAETP